ncbi:MAG: universal stress protein [Rhodospirillales bacterium]|nr:universal stress protein [Rhodospirillales bacterium]
MSYKTILIPVDGTETSQSALEMAFSVAQTTSAHLDVLHVRSDPKDVVPLLGEGMSGAMIEEMFDLAEKEAVARAARARDSFEDLCGRYNIPIANVPSPGAEVTACWIEETGREDEITIRRGRLCDLIVMARHTKETDAASALTLNAALFETSRPVLVAPPASKPTFNGNLAIAWNGSAEAAHAVSSAMPFISKAELVTVLTAESDQTSLAIAPDLATYLAWHGVHAELRSFPAGAAQIGAALLKGCADVGASMLVMGAYTHSRMRQLILGGVTRHVLAEATIPVLMTH